MVLLEVDGIYDSEMPDTNSQKTQITNSLKEPLRVGQTWYLIDAKWFKTFKYFVGMENCSHVPINPGPIDNTLLLDVHCTKIRRDLVENLDYVLLPASAWILLASWYGTKDFQQPIGRKVINVARPPKVELRVEIHEIELKLYDNPEFLNPLSYSFSSADPISKIEVVCHKLFKVPEEAQIQLRCFYGGPTMSQVLHSEYTVHEESLSDNLKIVMEILPTGQVAPTQTKNFTRPAVPRNREPSRIPRVVGPGVVTRLGATLSAGTMGSAEGRGQPCTPGLSGLMNLGNTCFLNSILQCLSNCGPITQYFQDGRHEREINATNPLGTSGEIACSFADVIKMMWSGRYATTVPHYFKLQLTKFAPQFAGSQQHDAQEVLTFLLDGLHEDLNRIKDKPYSPYSPDSDDDTLAVSTWNYFLSRNDSVIIDNFHGMLKSRVVCPDCEKVSVKFDTFSTLSLPLPLRCDRTVMVRWVPYNQNQSVTDLSVIVPKKGTIHDMIVELSNATSVNRECMIIAEISRSHFHRFFSNDDPIESIEEQDKIYMYDLPAELVNDETSKHTVLPIVLWETHDPARSSHFLSSLFGTPFLLYLPRRPIHFKELYDYICERMTRNCDGFMKENTSFGCFLMEYEDSVGGESGKPNPYLFSPVLVNTFNYDMKILQDDQEPFEVRDSFGRELLALQILQDVRSKHYHEHPVILAPRIPTQTLRPNLRPSLIDCLELFISTEKLGESNAWHCPQCKKKKRATKKLDLWKLPNILIFHLKRFAFNETRKEKLDTKVEFPLTGLNLNHIVMKKREENLEYNLIGVCNHYGSLMGGHYTAHCKSYRDGQWYCFDDNTVTPVSPESVQTESAYMLFYQRVPTSNDDPHAGEFSEGTKELNIFLNES